MRAEYASFNSANTATVRRFNTKGVTHTSRALEGVDIHQHPSWAPGPTEEVISGSWRIEIHPEAGGFSPLFVVVVYVINTLDG